ncbi:OmpH family outer membrane protein [Taibaiella soli]|uniref:OmpH family outer membrane protein n=1 Tax=Taibaiella soli TaxID=1649169 RepID=A0A2W2AG40_9BACT|nr:OmpH family outer membrane protein [Taibaiella soli]PZF74271.1 OmpH family outer membrane protein [Taibaiella soli]
MKKVILGILFVFGTALAAQAQRYCIIDSKYILEKLVDYKDAQTRLDQMSKQWQTEVDTRMAEVDRMYKSYQAERAMLSDDVRKKREDEIVEKEKAAKDLQKQHFGYEGDLFKKRQELVKPIQDRVYNAVQKMASNKGYDMVLDKAGGVTLFYADPKLDRSDDVLKLLGINK